MHTTKFSPKNTQQLNGKGIDDSMEIMLGITNGYQNYEKCECRDGSIKKEPESEK